MTPYQKGAEARLSKVPEPACPYTPGTQDYAEYARGYISAAPLIVPEGLLCPAKPNSTRTR